MIECSSCRKSFAPSPEQQKFLESAKLKNIAFIALKCPNCGMSFGYDIKQSSEETNKPETWKCPISHCDGWVVHVDLDKKYSDGGLQWACGECGSFWRSKDNLIKEVREIIKKFPYRSVFYDDINGQIMPSSVIWFPGSDEKIESEPYDTHDDYERG